MPQFIPQFVAIGECMVELSEAEGGLLRRGFAGDTFNTAYYARKLLPAAWTVSYLSALGDDALSTQMLAFMTESGIDASPVRRIAGKSPGLYMISLLNGERSFTYWRDTSAARQLADDPAHLAQHLAKADVIHFSGITLGILTSAATATLLDALRNARARGARISFDTNYRPRLWQGRSDTADIYLRAAGVADIVLPGLDDEIAVFGPSTPADVAARYKAKGASVVVVKDGAKGATVFDASGEHHVPAVTPRVLADTTAAGDSFAAAFLTRIAGGETPREAAAFAARIAAEVVSQKGALVPLPAGLKA